MGKASTLLGRALQSVLKESLTWFPAITAVTIDALVADRVNHEIGLAWQPYKSSDTERESCSRMPRLERLGRCEMGKEKQ